MRLRGALIIPVLAGLLSTGQADPAQALSCVGPQDVLQAAQDVVVGRPGPIKLVSTTWETPWDARRKVRVRTYATEVVTTRILRGESAPTRFRYVFRDRKLDCDFSAPVAPGRPYVFAIQRFPSSPQVHVTAFSRGMYAELTRPVRAHTPAPTR